MITQTAEYALRAVVYLAMNSGTAFTTMQVSLAIKVPAAYLSKVLQSLVRAGLLQSQRGLGGGFVLAKPPEEISLLEVLDAVDPIQRIQTCPLGLKAHAADLCALHKSLDDATAIIQKTFADTTIANILARTTGSTPLCNYRPSEGSTACAFCE